MKISEIKKLLPSIQEDSIDVNAMEVVEHYFFGRRDVSDYRESALRYMIENKADFTTTTNNVYNFAKLFVKVTCPKCGTTVEGRNGSGSSDMHTISYRCPKCKTEISISTPSNGYSVRFK